LLYNCRHPPVHLFSSILPLYLATWRLRQSPRAHCRKFKKKFRKKPMPFFLPIKAQFKMVPLFFALRRNHRKLAVTSPSVFTFHQTLICFSHNSLTKHWFLAINSQTKQNKTQFSCSKIETHIWFFCLKQTQIVFFPSYLPV
jgi:5-formyltetrahydrofolate cyclo-ligase